MRARDRSARRAIRCWTAASSTAIASAVPMRASAAAAADRSAAVRRGAHHSPSWSTALSGVDPGRDSRARRAIDRPMDCGERARRDVRHAARCTRAAAPRVRRGALQTACMIASRDRGVAVRQRALEHLRNAASVPMLRMARTASRCTCGSASSSSSVRSGSARCPRIRADQVDRGSANRRLGGALEPLDRPARHRSEREENRRQAFARARPVFGAQRFGRAA